MFYNWSNVARSFVVASFQFTICKMPTTITSECCAVCRPSLLHGAKGDQGEKGDQGLQGAKDGLAQAFW